MALSEREQAISTVQEALKKSGHYGGKVDGDLGPVTLSSIKAFQQVHSLSMTGRLNSASIDRLGVGAGAIAALGGAVSA